MKKYYYLLILSLTLFFSCQENEEVNPIRFDPLDSETSDSLSLHITLGNPSNAITNVSQNTNYLLEKNEFVMSYNEERGTANWVAWHLDTTWIGSSGRQDDFREDTSLPSSWYRVDDDDYRGSGFDRGHLCPSGDRTVSADINSATFVMSNMIPQAPENNRDTWRFLEEFSRDLVHEGNELYIIAGVEGIGGGGSNGGTDFTIANGNVTVPAFVWKVIVVLPVGENDVSRVTANTRVIAVRMPNNQSISNDWGRYRVSVDELEEALSYDFLSEVPENIQAIIEARTDTGPTDL
jgi:endonuclease G